MTPFDIINGATLDIGARAAGEQLPVEDFNEAFTILNLMLDEWSNESMMVFYKQEVIHELIGGQYIYTIGPGGSVGCSFTGSTAPSSTFSGGILTVTAISSGALSVGQQFSTAYGMVIITGYLSATGGSSSNTGALGTYVINQAYTVASTSFQSYAQRPLKINSCFVRVVNSISGTLDYPMGVLNVETYEQIGIKTLPGPWPRGVYYQPSAPIGVLNYWPNPSQGEVHLFVDGILNQFSTLYDTITLPNGVGSALRYNLAERLMMSYGKKDQSIGAMIVERAQKSKAALKRTNMAPAQVANFDIVLLPGKLNDSGWIMSGGF